MIAIQTIFRDFPAGPVVENLPSNAGDAGLIPGRGTKISHAAGHGQTKQNKKAHLINLLNVVVSSKMAKRMN